MTKYFFRFKLQELFLLAIQGSLLKKAVDWLDDMGSECVQLDDYSYSQIQRLNNYAQRGHHFLA